MTNPRGLVIDLFAGGGGASTGIEAALGRAVDIAINHDAVALAAHKANHPATLHLESDIWEVRPTEVTGGRAVDVLWASPDCTHFSVAKGGKPRKQGIRSLAWVVVKWAKAVNPATIFLENVSEFRGWGPLGPDGRPDKARMGETFTRWKRQLERLGYTLDYRVLDASLYGAPTKRRRLFLIARRDGQPIVWPAVTHGPGKLPVHTAAECIDWSLACPSIFERKKPLADKTLWRIAQGIRRFVMDNPRPFIVGVGGRAGQSAPTSDAEPVGTITAKNDRAIVAPSLVKVNHGDTAAGPDPRSESLEAPLSTVTAARRGHALVTPLLTKFQDHSLGQNAQDPLHTVMAGAPRFGVIAPTLIQTGYGEREGQKARVPGLHKPLGTVVAGAAKHALIAPVLERQFGQSEGAPVDEPVPTVMPGGAGKTALVSAFLAKHFGGVVGQKADQPAATITTKDHHSAVAATLVKMRGTNHGADIDAPAPTITAGGFHIAEVCAFLTAYYGEDATSGQSLFEPTRVITAKHRLGLVTVQGAEYQIVDIGMRMLEPHELLRAQFGRFAATYDLSAARTKSAKVRLIGNSVAPEVAEAVVRANWPYASAQAAAE